MAKDFKIFVLWGSGSRQHVRRVSIKNFKNYQKVGKYGRYNLYVKKGKKWSLAERVKKKIGRALQMIVAPAKTKREEAIDKIRGISRIIESTDKLEKRLLVNPNRYSRVSRRFISKQINPQGVVMSDGHIYKSFSELEKNKYGIYKDIILKNIKNEKLIKSIYANRHRILRDGMVIKLKLFGSVNERVKGIRYLGTIEITGLLIEDVRAIEGYIIGYSGYLEDLGNEVEQMVRAKQGKYAKIIDNNSVGTNVAVRNAQLEFNYA